MSKFRDAGGVLSEPEQLAIFVDKLNTNLDPVIVPIISKENQNVSFNDLLNELKNYERNSEMHEHVMFMKEKNINSLSKKLRNSI